MWKTIVLYVLLDKRRLARFDSARYSLVMLLLFFPSSNILI